MKEHVSGILTTGGTTNVHGSAVGHKPVLNVGTAQHQPDPERPRADVGVITILDVETSAVRLALGLRESPQGDLRFHTGEAREGITVAAIQSLHQGQRSAMAAYANLVRHHDPAVVVLTGIGGGIHKDIAVNDVVVATRVVYYDLRKETPTGPSRRGEQQESPAGISHAVNAFFSDNHPAEFPVTDPGGTTRAMRVHNGPIASGEAVIADESAETIAYLAAFNDKILAVDMEAGGLGLACHERSASTGEQHGWAVVRGISDLANGAKNDDAHHSASWHAAETLRRLLPYLATQGDPKRTP